MSINVCFRLDTAAYDPNDWESIERYSVSSDCLIGLFEAVSSAQMRAWGADQPFAVAYKVNEAAVEEARSSLWKRLIHRIRRDTPLSLIGGSTAPFPAGEARQWANAWIRQLPWLSDDNVDKLLYGGGPDRECLAEALASICSLAERAEREGCALVMEIC